MAKNGKCGCDKYVVLMFRSGGLQGSGVDVQMGPFESWRPKPFPTSSHNLFMFLD